MPVPAALTPTPQEVREHVPDPTVKTNLPKNLLAALGNTHVNLASQVTRIHKLLQTLGMSYADMQEFAVEGPVLNNALDYARENARLTWVLCGLVAAVEEMIGEFVWSDEGGGGTLHTSDPQGRNLVCMDSDCTCH